MRAHFEREPLDEWTSYNASLGRPLLNSQQILQKLSPNRAAGAAAGSDSGEKS